VVAGKVDLFDPGRQPSGRAPAPGRLGLVQAFANTFWDLEGGGADEWGDAGEYARWLGARGFATRPPARVTEADRARAIELREALRALAHRHHDDPSPAPAGTPALAVLDAAAARASLRVSFADGGASPVHVPVGDGPDDALALVVGVVAEAMTDGTWTRMKACPGPHCGWVFYDGSKNRSRQWCSMEICGNRVKGREFRARRRAGHGSR
jgi:predicted RNA-binding Zn ribbon-like protein